MYNQDRKPAVWTQVNDHFSVSEGGAIKPSGDAYQGRGNTFLTLEAAQHILMNIDSLRRAVDIQKRIVLNKETGKERGRMVANFVKCGLTPEQATAAVQAAFDNALKTAPKAS